MLEQAKAMIFDMDGTLIDSMWIWKDIDIAYLGRYGYTLPNGLQKAIEGMSYTETAVYFKETFSIPDTIEEIKEDWRLMAEHYYRHEIKLKKGAKEFLEYLKQRRIPMGIATSNSRDLAEVSLKANGILHYFDSVRTSCEVAYGKPAPDIYLKVAEDLHIKPSGCLVFEDVVSGILAGKRAGMQVCTVEDAGSAADEAEKRQIADYYIHNFYEVLEESYEVL